ncbi:MAG: pyridoxal-phosphate dependent enzyme, partial [Mycobacterium sp.]|nr:pyridoxal-phosphate dependent enzyme [Mycobacterium sp.]
ATIPLSGYDSTAPANSGPQPRPHADCPVKVEEPDYQLIVLSEVVSDFRTTEQLRLTFELAARCLSPGGRLVFSTFLAHPDYRPDDAAREFGQQCYTAIFTQDEMSNAAAGLPLRLVAVDSVYEYEKAHLPEGAWPPTGWYANWVRGLDVFDVEPEASPIEMRWLVYQKTEEFKGLAAVMGHPPGESDSGPANLGDASREGESRVAESRENDTPLPTSKVATGRAKQASPGPPTSEASADRWPYGDHVPSADGPDHPRPHRMAMDVAETESVDDAAARIVRDAGHLIELSGVSGPLLQELEDWIRQVLTVLNHDGMHVEIRCEFDDWSIADGPMVLDIMFHAENGYGWLTTDGSGGVKTGVVPESGIIPPDLKSPRSPLAGKPLVSSQVSADPEQLAAVSGAPGVAADEPHAMEPRQDLAESRSYLIPELSAPTSAQRWRALVRLRETGMSQPPIFDDPRLDVHGGKLYIQLENSNLGSHSIKDRAAHTVIANLPELPTGTPIVIASSGNHAIAYAEACRRAEFQSSR